MGAVGRSVGGASLMRSHVSQQNRYGAQVGQLAAMTPAAQDVAAGQFMKRKAAARGQGRQDGELPAILIVPRLGYTIRLPILCLP